MCFKFLWGAAIAAMLVGLVGPASSQEQTAGPEAIVSDRVIAGSEKDFMEVRHLVLKGSNDAIGRALAEIARARHHADLSTARDPLRTRAQRRYIQNNYPILYDRMRGVASAFGKRGEDDGFCFSWLDYGHLSGGCSVIHFPASLTALGTSIVSRDYDFTTGTFRGNRPGLGEQASTARPYVVEMYPDRGYSSLAVYSYDLLSGVLDGMNSEGLTVALLADDELMRKFQMEPAGFDGVGLGVLQTLRMLLDTSATADEAKEALLLTKQYYELVPVHYLIADRHGKAFIWEYSHSHNREYVVENPGRPLVTTNFSLHSRLEGGRPLAAKNAEKVCPRYCILTDRLNNHEGKLSLDYIKETHKLVDATQVNPQGSPRAPNRTLWHALYFPEQRKMQISFYLRDSADPDQPGKVRIVRSEYLNFALGAAKASR